jgi:acyl carrier protein
VGGSSIPKVEQENTKFIQRDAAILHRIPQVSIPITGVLKMPERYHPILGQRLTDTREISFTSQCSAKTPRHLDDHRLYGMVVVPAAYYLALVLASIQELFASDSCTINQLLLLRPLVVSEGSTRTVRLVVIAQEEDSASFQFLSAPEEENIAPSWILQVSGKVQISKANETLLTTEIPSVEELQERCRKRSYGAEFYTRSWEVGYTLGSSFRWIGPIWEGEQEALCQMHQPELPDTLSSYLLYPGLIDSCFQLLGHCWASKDPDISKGEYILIPFSISSFQLHRNPGEGQLWCWIRMKTLDGSKLSKLIGDITLFDGDGRVIAEIYGCEFRKASRNTLLLSLQTEIGLDSSLLPGDFSKEPTALIQQLRITKPRERRTFLVNHVCALVAQVLGLDPMVPLDIQQGFFDLGIDSISSVALSGQLQTSLGQPLSATLAFDYPTVDTLVDYLIQEVLPTEFVTLSAPEQGIDAVDALEELSQDEIADLLAQELASLT